MNALIVASLLFVGCSEDKNETGTSDHHHDHGGTDLPDDFDPATAMTTHDGSVTVSYTTDPSPIPESALFSVTIAVTGGTVTEADATMPTHGGHGMTVQPELTDNGDGTFTASPFEFHMPGYWVIHATVENTEGESERADFDVDCCE